MENKPDVSAIMAQINAAIERKKAEGYYDPQEVRKVEQAALSLSQAKEELVIAEISRQRAALNELHDPTQYAVTTHRQGLKAQLILKIKKLVYKLSKFPLNVWLARQQKFNLALVQLINALSPQDIWRRLTQADLRLDALEDITRETLQSQRHAFNHLQETMARLAKCENEQAIARRRTNELLSQLESMISRQGSADPAASGLLAEVHSAKAKTQSGVYLTFENLHRGSREEILERQRIYLPYFKDTVSAQAPLLDLGCGRGEFLEAARQAGLAAQGVDQNPEMVELCRSHGLEAHEADGLDYLRSLADSSLGGILMAQVIEHLTADQLIELIGLSAEKLRPGGVLIAETVNPTCLFTFAGAFYLDLTHQKPVHPETVRFLWDWAGLTNIEIKYLSPVAQDHRLEAYPLAPGKDDLADLYNRNVQRLNNLLYSYLDYAVIGFKADEQA